VILTPRSNDKGADVVVFSEKENLLIQVKQSNKPIGDTPIGEILKSKGYYENKYQNSFSLAVVTNNRFNENAEIMAKTNGVQIYDRFQLSQYIKEHPLTLDEIIKMERKREK